MDPLASNKGFWAEMLGVGDFYYELSVQITEICLATRGTNGGLIALQELVDRLRAKRSRQSHAISADDVRRAIGEHSFTIEILSDRGFAVTSMWPHLTDSVRPTAALLLPIRQAEGAWQWIWTDCCWTHYDGHQCAERAQW